MEDARDVLKRMDVFRSGRNQADAGSMRARENMARSFADYAPSIPAAT